MRDHSSTVRCPRPESHGEPTRNLSSGSVTPARRLNRTEAIRTLPPTRSPYEQHRDYVLAVLGRRCGWLDPSDREAILHEAYAVLLEKQRDLRLDVDSMRPAQVRAYLTQTALNKAMDESKRAGRRRSVSLDDERLRFDPASPDTELDEQVSIRFEGAFLREIMAELPERRRTIVNLRFVFDRSPEEITRYLGVTERVYRRELELAARRIAERFELVRNGTFCDSRRSLILAYVTGVAGPGRIRDARRHLANCPACASWIREMPTRVDRAGSIAPPIPFARPVRGLRGDRGRNGSRAAPQAPLPPRGARTGARDGTGRIGAAVFDGVAAAA
jgi:DNA-directed RNA polymerase specialized sigma24 family protein